MKIINILNINVIKRRICIIQLNTLMYNKNKNNILL